MDWVWIKELPSHHPPSCGVAALTVCILSEVRKRQGVEGRDGEWREETGRGEGGIVVVVLVVVVSSSSSSGSSSSSS